MEKIKGFFSGILGIVIFIASISILTLILIFGAYIAQIINPILTTITTIGTIICVFILIPLSIFKKTRIISCYGLMVVSYIFGANLWVFSFLTTYFYWGFIGVVLGLFVMGIGVLPFAFIASLFHSNWAYIGNIIYLCILTFGSRFLATYLAGKIDKESYLKENLKQEELIIDDLEIKETIDSEPEYVWTCEYCKKEFDSKSDGDEHEEMCKLNPKNITSDDEPEYIWTCEYCGEDFDSESEASKHELTCKKNIKNEEEVWTCDFCDKEFETKKEADKHEKICELNIKNREIKTKVYCVNCGVENPIDANFCKKCGNKIIT